MISQSKGGKVVAKIVGATTSKGQFVSIDELTGNGMQIVRDLDGKPVLTYKDADASGALQPSHGIGEDQDPFDYDREGIIAPPWKFEILSHLQTLNTIHGSAIETKAADYAYNRPQLETMAWAAEHVPEETLAAAREEVLRFLASVAEARPIEDLCRDVAIDYEALGSAGFEIRRNGLGFIGALNHIPFSTMRVLKQTERERTGARFLQKRFDKAVRFVDFNKTVEFRHPSGQIFDPLVAKPDEFPEYDRRDGCIKFREPLIAASGDKHATDLDSAANEFYYLARSPFTRSEVYGTPAGVTAYGAMLAQLKIDQYNLSFFSNKGVPQYAIIFEGVSPPSSEEGLLSTSADVDGDDNPVEMAPSETAMLEATIEEFFKRKLAGSDRSVLVLTMFGEAKVKFERLSNDTLEASFADYEKRNRETVRIAHRIPGPALGIYETANLGGGRDTAAMKRYRDHIVAPGQRVFENVVNALIRSGLLIPYFEFSFAPMNLEEESEARNFALKEFIAGGIMLDEYRERTGREALPDGKGRFFLIRTQNVTMINLEEAGLEKQLRRAVASETAFRKLLSGEATLDELDEFETELEKHINEGSEE